MKRILFTAKFFSSFIFCLGIFFSPVYAGLPSWVKKVKKVEVLKSTKTEIEKLFGNPRIIEIEDLASKFKNGWGKTVKYETEFGELEVDYAAGKCSESQSPYAYNVSKEIVLEFTFRPNEINFEQQLGYDLSKFTKNAASDSETDKTYSLETNKSGIKIEIEGTQISSVNFYIPDKQKGRLECQNVKIKEPIWLEKLRKLELFKSTRTELEILFESPRIIQIDDSSEKKNGWGLDIEYETLYGNLAVEYSTGKCSESKSKYAYDAPKDSIVSLTFEPTEKIDPTEMNFDLRKFSSDPEACIPEALTYRNSELGVEIYFIGMKLESIEFTLTDELKNLDCEKVLNLQK